MAWLWFGVGRFYLGFFFFGGGRVCLVASLGRAKMFAKTLIKVVIILCFFWCKPVGKSFPLLSFCKLF